MRQDRSFIISFLKEHALEDTAFCKVLRDVIFSNIPCSDPEVSLDIESDANPYSAIWNKYLDQKQSGYATLPIPGTDSEDQEAVRKLTDRNVMVTRGKHRGRTGSIIGAGKGYYIVGIDGDEWQIKGAHLELHDEDLASSDTGEQFEAMEEEPPQNTTVKRERERPQPRVDPDFEEVTGTRLVQRKVIIREGKLSEQIGVVTSSGHGFYCVRARGVQVKLRRREFEVCEDDGLDDELTLAQDPASDARQDVPHDNIWIGKQASIKASGRHKGKQGLVVDLTACGVLTIAVGEERVLAFVEDVEDLGPPPARPAKVHASLTEEVEGEETKAEARQPASFINMKVLVKAGKHQGAVGTVTSVDHGWHCVLLDGALDEPALRMRSKDIELYDSANEVPGAGAANPSTVARGAPAQVPKEEEDQLDKVLVKAGKYSGQVGYVKATQANGWHTIDVQGNLICLRVPDFERQGKGVPQMVAVHATTAENKELLNKKVILVGGKHDGKVGLVSNILNNNWHSVTVEGPDSLELRVRRSDLREYTEGAGGAYGQGNNDAAVVKSEEENEAELPTRSDDDLDESKRKRGTGEEDADGDDSKANKLKRARPDDGEADEAGSPVQQSKVTMKSGKYRGQVGKVLSSGHGWLWVKVGNEDVRVRRRDVAVLRD